MYGYSSVHVQYHDGWYSDDIGDVSFKHYKSFNEVRIALTNDNLDFAGELRITNPLKDLVNASDEDTLKTWLVKNDNLYIDYVYPYTDWDAPRKNIVMVDLIAAGYKIVPSKPDVSPDTVVLPDDCNDLFISKENVSGHDFSKNMLVCVNGLIHKTKSNESGCYVLGGYHHIRNDGYFQLHGICTRNISAFKLVDFKDKVHILDFDMNRNVVTLKVGEDIADKNIALVIGGFLYLQSECYKLVGRDKIQINFNNMPLVERHLQHYTALTPSVLTETRKELTTNITDIEGLTNLLRHDCTFLVVFDTAFGRMYCDSYPLENARLNGKYIHIKPVVGIPRLENHLIAPLYTWTNGENLVSSTHNFAIPNYEFYDTDTTRLRVMDNQLNRFEPHRLSELVVYEHYVI